MEKRDPWEEEDERRAQEKHDELFWSEIEDGLAPPTPRHISFGKQLPMSDENKRLAEDLERLQEEWKRKGKL